jgi:hypothetical protein
MHVNPGPHSAVPPAEFKASEEFFAKYLKVPAATS